MGPSLSRRDYQRHGRLEAARWEPSRSQAVYSVDLMLVWDTGPGLQSLHNVAWEAETKGQSWRPWGQAGLVRAVSALKGGNAGPCVGQGTK